MIKLTGIGVLIFFLVFVASAERCLDKNECDGNNENSARTAIRDIFSQRRVERESRVVNIRGRVGSERLVNNRRIVDSDSRLSNFPVRLDNSRRDVNRLMNKKISREREMSGGERIRIAERTHNSETSRTRREADDRQARYLTTEQSRIAERTGNERERFRRERSLDGRRERDMEVRDNRRVAERIGGPTERVRDVLDQTRRHTDKRDSENRLSKRIVSEMREERGGTTMQRRVAEPSDTQETRRVPNSLSSERNRQSDIQERSHRRAPLRYIPERNARDLSRENNERTEGGDRIRNVREMSRSVDRSSRARRNFERVANRERGEITREERLNTRDARRNLREQVPEASRAPSNQQRTTLHSQRNMPDDSNSIDENNNKIYRSYLNQEYNRFDTAWSKLLTTFLGVLIIGQIVHSKLDSKRFYHLKKLFTATKEKVC